MDPKLLKTLLDPRAYPEETTSVTLRQTHISFIFLTDSFVYKIKKPVDFGFLNFTTIDRRRFFCEEEVRLNRRLSPTLYLGVVPVREAGSALSFRNEGSVVDYAVKMKRLPADRMLDRIIERRELTREALRAITQKIARFHLAAERGPAITPFGSTESIARNWNDSFREIGKFVGTTIDATDLARLQEWFGAVLRDNEALFRQRQEEGFIRDCDGDLHSGNICLTDEDIFIFDCIEFNERFRYGDTASDIAFFLMDLEFRGAGHLAGDFIEEYRRITGDVGFMPLLDFYRTYRALVRGKVNSLTAIDPQVPPADRESAAATAERYFRLARGYTLRNLLKKTLVVTTGLPGSGKSAIAREVAMELGLNHFSTDIIRKELAGLHPFDHSGGEALYAPASTTATYDELYRRCTEELAAGRSVVADGTFSVREGREHFRELARREQARFLLIHTSCDEETTEERLLQRDTELSEASDAGIEVYRRLLERYEIPDPAEEDALQVDTGAPMRHNVRMILRALELPA